MKDIYREIIKVHVRKNNGEDTYLQPHTILEALDIAKRARNANNYMVCIEIDDDRTHRWDREFAINANRWRKREPDAREPKGRLPSVYQTREAYLLNPASENQVVTF